MIDLAAEMDQAARNLRQPHLDQLKACLGGRATAHATGAGLIGVAKIAAERSYFWPADDGKEAYILPCVEGGEIVDLVAWSPKKPADWRWRVGSAGILGIDQLRPTWDNLPVKIRTTPLAWLAAGGDGICILDWSSPDLCWLECVDAIIAELYIAHRLKKVMMARRLPRFLAHEAGRNAA